MTLRTGLCRRPATIFTLSLLAACGGGGGDGTDSALPAAADDREHAAATTTCFTCTLPPPIPANGLPHWKQIAAGKWHSCGVTPGNVAYCWGLSNSGQLGTGVVNEQRNTPARVAANGRLFGTIGTGESHTCALDTAQHAYCWGANNNNQLGNGGSGAYSTLPVAVGGGGAFTALSVGANHSCALDGGGRAYCWGYGSSGQLGNNSFVDSGTPALVQGGYTFSVISAGRIHSCGLTTSGEAYCWGSNADGQLGIEAYIAGDNIAEVPLRVAGGRRYKQISAGYNHTCAVTIDDRLYCWGANRWGQLTDIGGADHLAPTATVPLSSRYQSVTAANTEFTCAVSEGLALCWGHNNVGQLGNGTLSEIASPTPTQVVGPFGLPVSLATISAGTEHGCGVSAAGQGVCWGVGSSGQLGQGVAASSTRAVLVKRPM